MSVIPVIDLKGGEVVRGIGGRRNEYRRVESRWAASAAPGEVARVWRKVFGFRRTYVADLDAITARLPNWEALRDIAAAGLQLLLDAGTGSTAGVSSLLSGNVDRSSFDAVIVGLESLSDPSELHEMVKLVGPERALFSIDLQQGRLLTPHEPWSRLSIAQVAERVVTAGFRRLIVLDLAGVGVPQGPLLTAACREIRAAFPDVELISGGGVRHMSDVRSLVASGCNGVLVASALHDGAIHPADLGT